MLILQDTHLKLSQREKNQSLFFSFKILHCLINWGSRAENIAHLEFCKSVQTKLLERLLLCSEYTQITLKLVVRYLVQLMSPVCGEPSTAEH